MAEPYGKYRDTHGQPDGDYGGQHLVVRTAPVPDPGDLVSRLPDPAAVAWIRHGAGLVGWGEAARVTLPAGDDRFTSAEKWLREVTVGADVRDDVERRGSVLVVPRAVLGRDGEGNAWLTTIVPKGEPSWHAVPHRPLTEPDGVRWYDGSLSAPEWERAVAAAVRRISLGELRKVVLARDLYASAMAPIDARVLLRRLSARYPDCFTFACGGLVGATPELLIRRDGSEVSSLVLAGTMPRGVTADEDARLAAALLGSAKDNEEHSYAAASLRDAIAPLCETLDIAPRPELIAFANVQHLGTRVRGTLGADRSALALAAALHPTAAVGGTPTDVAVELIRELENMDRERYAGPVGWVDANGNGEWGIALRCAQLSGGRARLFAGCGIVAGSDPAAELAEAQVKFRPMQTALGQGD